MFKHLLLLPLMLATACTTYTITEENVFTPFTAYQAPANAQAVNLSLEHEEVFSGLTGFMLEIEAWEKQKVAIGFDAGELEPAKVMHGFLKANPTIQTDIAYSLISRDDPSRPLIVHCGGNTAARKDSGTLYGLKLIEFGDAFLFDYPGYGDSPGKPTVQSLKNMRTAITEFVKAESANGRPVILWGHSLGGFVCADMAASFERVDAIVLETSARNAAEVADSAAPWFAKPFVDIIIEEEVATFDNIHALNNVDVPIMVIGAKKDRTLSVHLSRMLAKDLKAGGHDITYTEFPEANHISVAAEKDFPVFVETFLSRTLHKP